MGSLGIEFIYDLLVWRWVKLLKRKNYVIRVGERYVCDYTMANWYRNIELDECDVTDSLDDAIVFFEGDDLLDANRWSVSFLDDVGVEIVEVVVSVELA